MTTERRSIRDNDDRGRDRGGRDDRGSRDRDDDRGSRSRDSGRDSGRSASSGFSYRKRSAEEVNKRSNMGAKTFDSFLADHIKAWKVNDGANTIRPLPPTWPDPEHYGLDIWVHYGVGPDEQSYLCLHKMKGEPCPICEERERARKEGETEEYIKDLEPTRRVLFYLIDRDKEAEGVMAWAAPWTIDRDITKISVDRKTGDVLPVDDPDEGYDIEFDRTGKGLGTKYVGVAIARRESPLGKKAWLDFAIENPLPSILEYHSYDHIQKVLGGGGSHRTRSDRDRDDDERDTRRDSRSDRDEPRRGRDRDDDGDSRGARGRRDEPELTWDSVHSMTGKELDALVEEHKLDINVNKASDDAELADWICDEMKIEKETRRGRDRDDRADDDAPASRLRGMRDSRR